MKKVKFGFGEGGFQGFMARHVEKVVLSVVIALMAFFIYSGSTTKSLENKSLTRESLKKSAQDADLAITNSTSWTEVEIERKPKVNPFLVVSTQVAKVDADLFAPPVWDVTLIPRLKPRTDPRLYGAENLVATPIFGPLVLTPPEMEEEEEEFDPAKYDPLSKYPITIGGTGGMGFGGAPAMPAMAGEEDEKEEKKTRKRKGKQEDPMGSYPMPGMGTTGSKSKRPTNSKKKDKEEEEGYPGMAMASSAAGGQTTRSVPPEAMVGVKAPQGSLLRPVNAIVVTASVPYAKQWEAFRTAFQDAPGGQDPTRDVPNYVTMFVERVDVTEDPDSQAWENLSRPSAAGAKSMARQFEELEAQYAVQINEIVDPEALDPKLTHPVPPLLLTDLSSVMTHPDVPRIDPKKLRDYEDESDMEEEPEFTDDGLYLGRGDDESDGLGTGRMKQSAPRAGGAMMGAPRMPGSSRPAAGPKMPAGGARMAPAGPRGSAMGGMPRGGMPGRGMAPAPGRGGAVMGKGGGGDLENKPVAKKLVRFVDFDAKPGRNYRYRIQLVIEDPNRPQDPDMEPEESTLSEEVRERLKKSGAKRTWYIVLPPSEPTPVVSVPSQEKFYAGETVPGTTIPMANGKVTVATGEPTTKVLAVQWDKELGVFAPVEQSVARGGVLNVKSDVEVLHPVEGNVRKIPEYQVRTNAVVLDMFGGEVLPGSDSRDLERAPGETLILDASGNLIVTDESRDVEGYRRYIFPEPKEDPKKAAAGTPMGPTGADYPMPGKKGGKGGMPTMGPTGPGGPGKTRGNR